MTEGDVLHFDATNPKATFIGDLGACDPIPGALFDCIILTQTLHLIVDIRAALANAHRLLAPGGCLIATFPGIGQISDEDWGPSWCWGWSAAQARRLLDAAFPGGAIEVTPLGNRLAAVAFLFGLAAEDLDPAPLAADPGSCDFLIGAVARRGGSRP